MRSTESTVKQPDCFPFYLFSRNLIEINSCCKLNYVTPKRLD